MAKPRQMQWRDMFAIAVKWRRIADPEQPVLWLDQMPARSLSRGFNNHINLIRGQIINIRYLAYFDKILNFIKDRILVLSRGIQPKRPTGSQTSTGKCGRGGRSSRHNEVLTVKQGMASQ